jgi:hypothetical protein
VTRKFEENVFEVGKNRPEIGYADLILGKTVNYFRHEIFAAAANGEAASGADHLLNAACGSKKRFRTRVSGGENDRPLRTVPRDEFFRGVYFDDASVFDDRNAVAQAFGFFH